MIRAVRGAWRLSLLGGAVAALLAQTVVATAAPAPPTLDGSSRWSVRGTPVEAIITGGPWTLGQGPASNADPAKDYPHPNSGTELFQPYYFPATTGTDRVIDGVFDYRPRNLEEAIVSARSVDGGRSWTFTGEALDFTPNPTIDPQHGSDDGQGHPYVMRVGSRFFLYTLDRQAGVADQAGLLVRRVIAPVGPVLFGLPANETPPSTASQTVGLLNPDGILGKVPGSGPSVMVLYVQKILGDTAVHDQTIPRLARTDDGIHFTDLGPISGLTDSTTIFIASRGTVARYGVGRYTRYGLFYSGGTLADADSDAFHFIGYAESTDLLHWTVINGLGNPLLSRDTINGVAPQTWYSGRVYNPSVTFSANGLRATMIFAGYHTSKPKNDLGNYRTIGVVSLERPSVGLDDIIFPSE